MAHQQDYSTLEVNNSHQAPEVYYNPDQYQKEALATGHGLPSQQYPEVAYNQYGSPQSSYPYGTPTTAYNSASPGTIAHTSLAKDGTPYQAYADAPEVAPNQDGTPPKKRICGLAARTFYIVLAVIVVIVIAAIGGGVGGALASRGSSSSSANNGDSTGGGAGSGTGNSTSTSPPGPKPLGITKIAATNWTDGNNVGHRNVYFQDEYNYIIERRWDSDSNNWSTSNISKLFETSTTFGPQFGTSLTVAVMDKGGSAGYEIQLYFLDAFNFIRSVHTVKPDIQPDAWTNNTLDGAYLEVRKGSHLSAMYQDCWNNNCAGSWCVAYQRPSDGSVKTANSSHWTVSDVAVVGTDLSNNSSLALIPRLVNQRLSGAMLGSSGVATASSAPLQISVFDDAWVNATQSVAIQSAALPSEQNNFAATQYNNWRDALFLSLSDDGSLKGVWTNDGTNKMSLLGAPAGTKFTAIAFTLDAHFYGISGEQIQEYELDKVDPSILHYVGNIWPAQ
ncbi:uncharacterized protein B0I36DRAFT_343813 [Microdochium trichocladiopsis]|uniref:Fucose-specific lectin n=1 Tax=Microdochium trichocladiopsis TaxID=1682393 RepID=A0A9P8YDW5_9PEZI|nr:uncharacterized protein B0I36DRAFT_343813 [Microdochium trichocladiopsis]KAH7040007.1 hypothetical protein B0I36DRAFT_343813 [Microdochium trichocladiopsis]